MSQADDIKALLMYELEQAVRANLADGYLSISGIPMDKRPIDKRREYAAVALWAKAVFIANQHSMTPHYWQMKAVDKVKKVGDS